MKHTLLPYTLLPFRLLTAVLLMLSASACNTLDDDRIPALPVNINLTDIGMWNTYGVFGFGQHREFIRELRKPANYSYGASTYTGYGGILLISGMDAYSTETNVPLAYDLSCPVECRADIRVYFDSETLEAVCPVCGSRYNVCEAAGAPVAGPALEGKYKYRLQPYLCIPSASGGYLITRR